MGMAVTGSECRPSGRTLWGRAGCCAAGHVSPSLGVCALRPQETQCVPVPTPPPHRHGLSEAELKDVLSLDDEVLQAVYQDWTPPSKELLRFPPLMWVRLRRDLGHCLTHRPVDGFTLLAIAHRWVRRGGRALWASGSEGSLVGAPPFSRSFFYPCSSSVVTPRRPPPLCPQPLSGTHESALCLCGFAYFRRFI